MMSIEEKRFALAGIKNWAVQKSIESMISTLWPRSSAIPPAKVYGKFGLTIRHAAENQVELAFRQYQPFIRGYQPNEEMVPSLRGELTELFEFDDSAGSYERAFRTEMLGGKYPDDSYRQLVKSASSLRIAQVHAYCHRHIARMKEWKSRNNWVEQLLTGGLDREALVQCAERYLAKPASGREETAVHQLVRSLVSLQA